MLPDAPCSSRKKTSWGFGGEDNDEGQRRPTEEQQRNLTEEERRKFHRIDPRSTL
ncbi:hypothetical protein [Bradyrhizobium neotropicale]|uniref:hypothetical protein n=1 Tax=Bradyrhizobium neotropicale TaxID=1497615 RepID=UPI001AD75BD8|nr:hypothetical protein [Bradyrhizobium neotropicale]MBO4227249.1 hypothetical protein [Bradyrhizobium neotropicale]